MSVAPKLLDKLTEKDTFGTTLYFEIKLGDGIPAHTGVFFPSKHKPGKISLILYLHGNIGGACGGDTENHSIRKVWKQGYFKLREKLDETGKNLILVAPTLSTLDEQGKLAQDGGSWYLDQVIRGILKHGPGAQGSQAAAEDPLASVLNIILACHSGGGWPMYSLAKGMTGKTGKYGAYLRECWGFDCLYQKGTTPTIPPQSASPENLWFEWARVNAKVQLHFHWFGTRKRTGGLDWLSKKPPRDLNVHVTPELYDAPVSGKKDPTPGKSPAPLAKDHCTVPITHWVERIDKANLQSA